MNLSELEQKLREDIGKIQERGDVYNEITSYVYLGDGFFDSALKKASSYLKEDQDTLTSSTVGMVIGSSGLLSLCPELPVDIWLVLDNNRFVLDWVDTQISAVRSASSLNEFKRLAYKENPLYLQIKERLTKMGNGNICREEDERLTAGRYHITFSEQRFRQIKKAVEKSVFVRCEGDSGDVNFLKSVGDILKKYDLKISTANLTNIYEVTPTTHQALPNLPFDENAVIMWAEHSQFGCVLYGNPLIGLSQYTKISSHNGTYNFDEDLRLANNPFIIFTDPIVAAYRLLKKKIACLRSDKQI